MTFKKSLLALTATLLLIPILTGCGNDINPEKSDDTSEIAGTYMASDKVESAMLLFERIEVNADGTANIYSINDPKIETIEQENGTGSENGPNGENEPGEPNRPDPRPENNIPVDFNKKAGEVAFDNGNGVIYTIKLEDTEAGDKTMVVYFNDNPDPVQTLVLQK